MSFHTNSDLQLHRFAHAGGNLHQPLLEQPMFSSASLKVEVKTFRSDVLGPSLDHNNKSFEQALCSRRFSCKASLVKHVKSRHSDGAVLKPRKKPAEKKYKCDTCRKSFSSENYLEVHKRAHKGLKPFECHVCGKMYLEYSAFCAHRMIHVKPHRCNQCDKSFPFPTLLKKHMRSHVKTHLLKTKRKKPEGGEEEEKKACHFCSKVFKRKENLEAHLRRHMGVKPYRCDLCELAFHDRNLLSRHKFMHAWENGDCGHKCEVCGLAFQKMSHLNSHMVTHSGLKPYKCEFCDKAYSQSGSLIVHRRLHTGVRPYSCPFCDKTFRDHSSWRSHKATHTKDKIYKCDICQKSFTRMDSVTTHKKLHSGVRPHKCDLCERAFSDSSGLKKHRMVHTGEKPHDCQVCDKRFSRVDNLRTHMRVHSK